MILSIDNHNSSLKLNRKIKLRKLVKSTFPIFCICVANFAVADQEFAKKQEKCPNSNIGLCWDETELHKGYSAAVEALGSAFGKEKEILLIEMAELYLSHMLLQESKSLLLQVDEGKLGGGFDRKLTDLNHALNLLSNSPKEIESSSGLFSPGRSDRAVWVFLRAIREGNSVNLKEGLDGIIEGLSFIPQSVQREIIPSILLAMLATKRFSSAEEIYDQLNRFPEHKNSAMAYFVLGQIESARKNQKSALGAFLKASKKYDSFAARARLEIAKLALESGDRGAKVVAFGVLSSGLRSWRGGTLERQILFHYIDLADQLNRTYEATVARKTLLDRYPVYAGQAKITQRIRHDLELLYTKGKTGEITLTSWVKMHEELVPHFREFASFAFATEMLGDSLASRGATDLAIQKYSHALQLLFENQKRGIATKLDSDIFRVSIKRINAYIEGGQNAEAIEAFSKLEEPNESSQIVTYQRLRSQILSISGNYSRVLTTTATATSADHIREIASAAFEIQAMNFAALTYASLWRKFPSQLTDEDALNLFVSAFRSGNTELAQEVSNSFPTILDSEVMAKIAKHTLNDDGEIGLLKHSLALKKINEVDKTMNTLGEGGY